ncbi:nitrite reductase small subunit NirD [Sphaerisporangium flaviroseum]|uniref:Nitrite reductase small subunit NirD n=1 Tax=Sphaerisporangium flaviroseum TaxID=509199 RepID=A0ABP7IP90_9ACTN
MTIVQKAPETSRSDTTTRRWSAICHYTDLIPERGAAALIRGRQVAVFRAHDGRLFAVGNHDPFSGAYVISRGIVGTLGQEPVVATPMHKQVFSLVTGACLDDPATAVPIYPTRVTNGTVEVSVE